jgi:RNA polymerase sigma-70 factor (ECF subfamily)
MSASFEPGSNPDAQAARSADVRARFQALYEESAPALYTWVHVRLRARFGSRLDPQDVMQEVWLRALQRHADFDPARGRFRSWIVGIAKLVLLEGFDRLSLEPRFVGNADSTVGSLLEREPDPVTSITRRLARDDGIRRFLEFVDTLEPDDRRIVLHCGFEEFTCAATAVQLGLTTEAVQKRWQRLRSRMREAGWDKALGVESL